MLFFILIFGVYAENLLEQLEKENRELKKAYTNLQKQIEQVSKLIDFGEKIHEDYTYNIENLEALIEEYQDEEDYSVKLDLAEELIPFIQGIIEDSKFYGGEINGFTTSQLNDVSFTLKTSIQIAKDRENTRTFETVYNELKNELINKDEIIMQLQIENAKLNGDLQTTIAEFEENKQKCNIEHTKLISLQDEINTLKRDHAESIEVLSESLKTQQKISHKKQLKDFKTIQESQDSLILDLQDKNADQTLLIEQLSVEKSSLASRLQLLENSNDRLQSELISRTSQLQAAHEKFDDFRKKVESETMNQITSIEGAEGKYKNEIKALDAQKAKMTEELTKCEKERDILITNSKQKDKRISNLESSKLDKNEIDEEEIEEEEETQQNFGRQIVENKEIIDGPMKEIAADIEHIIEEEIIIKKLSEIDKPEIRVRTRYDFGS
ncbi:unnamed protein product [Blepharisma stoltei]|uniref:Uncharacterized protein n=1 Tax=Blepharisma stoltei TaxID=1481888 RepID=A0AAU9J223_9CILI|nr:unnamed protein product [Blepharisma stoltei]